MKRWKPDHEVLQALVAAGFTELVLPFESGNRRIIKKYASNKLNIDNNDIAPLIAACKGYNLRVTGNYMIGYPDETLEEIATTIELARRHMACGLDAANFFLVMPLPGTPLYDMACREGHLRSDFDPDTMNWTRANMANTPVPAAVHSATLRINSSIKDQVVNAHSQPVQRPFSERLVNMVSPTGSCDEPTQRNC